MPAVIHTFADPRLHEEALTHSSWSGEHGGPDYQRLEFLGDAVVKLVGAELLVGAHASWPEGRLTRALGALVSNQTLARLADALDLPAQLRMGVGARGRHEERQLKVRADVFEAVVGAVFADGGLEGARSMLNPLFAPLIATLDGLGDPKSRLNMLADERKWPHPTYASAQTGAAHSTVWTVSVTIETRTFGPATGRTKKEAESAVAELALDAIE